MISQVHVRRLCEILIVLGLLMRFYGINDPWKRNDHYNYGGVWTTVFAECLKTVPLAISKGVASNACWTAEPQYYRNHPPTVLFGMWAWTSLFGAAEWSYRLFILIFSALNVAMIFLIARVARPGIFPYLAAAFQACFLGNMYFATHLDFIGEPAVFFVLLASWLALRGRVIAASSVGVVAGLVAWPGYLFFAPLWIYAWMTRRRALSVAAIGALAFLIACATMMWLQQRSDVFGFLMFKIFTPGYVKADNKGWLEPVYFVRNFISSQSRLLSPLLASFAFFEMTAGAGRDFFKRKKLHGLSSFHHAILLTGGSGLAYALLSHEYVMVHIFLYLFLTPGLALLAARCVEKLLDGERVELTRREYQVFMFIAVLCAALYPYGIYKSGVVIDVVASVFLIIAVLASFWVLKKPWTARAVLAVLCISIGGNVLQLINYRNEPDTERSFCDRARAEIARTHLPFHTTEARSDAKDLLYCRGLNIQYDQPTQ